jgi:isoamylase
MRAGYPRTAYSTHTADVALRLTRGRPLPLGATLEPDGINFAVCSSQATSVTLVIMLPGKAAPVIALPLEPYHHRTGDIWHGFIHGLGASIEYGYLVDRPGGPEATLHGLESQALLLDPYARAVSGAEVWGQLPVRPVHPPPWERVRLRRSVVMTSDFAWGSDRPLHRHLADSIIYELHVRGFTRHKSSQVAHPGTFMGVVEKIPYLQELGITAVELMPVAEFEEHDNPRVSPFTGEPLMNFWGYHPIGLFAPKAGYTSRGTNGAQVTEFKSMVKALHAADIEVILDVVFNHTGEGEEHFPTWSLRGLDNPTYYLNDPASGSYRNYSGCGNTLNCNHPVVQDMIIDCLRYWATEMHVDGFRFDLASIMSRGQDGGVLAQPPLLERIAADPILAHVKLIAEPWDATGLYQIGTFPRWGRWAEWNDQFRDDIRRFVKGDAGMVPRLAARLVGSPDLYEESAATPCCSINFVTSHDGFTLADLVTYNHKHNHANGEDGRDGRHDNCSWNCGEEGPSISPEVCRLRTRQMKNMTTLLLVARGVPMLLSGDEMARSQQGNNNTYCHDDEHSWIDWEALEYHADLFRFFKLLIRFRKQHPLLRCRSYDISGGPQAPAFSWHGCQVGHPDWSWESRSLAMQVSGGQHDVDLLVIANAHWQGHPFELPPASAAKRWYTFVDTMQEPPNDICQEGEEQPLVDPHRYEVGPRTVVVLVGK